MPRFFDYLFQNRTFEVKWHSLFYKPDVLPEPNQQCQNIDFNQWPGLILSFWWKVASFHLHRPSDASFALI